ncbi:MAG TPA: crossover junction endodeoxyribonuclease RuvC [Actinomycetota bacterium]|nr:crossover junction endodeoxyribonuclease RuvC [Actinomycetota bacterium]
MRVLGVDPGFATMGVAVVERDGGALRALSIGALRSPRGGTQAARLAYLWREVAALIDELSPDVMAIERVFFNANVRTAMAVGQSSGVALAAAAQAGLEVHEYTPPEVKQSVVGVGNASKQQVQTMVAAVLGLGTPPEPPDAADACALAICHINRGGLAAALAKQVAR